MRRCRILSISAIVLLVVIILSEWLWWESYKVTVDWGKRQQPFPLPFYLIVLPNWFIVDLAIALITLSALTLTILLIQLLLEPEKT